jgi:threonine/homoserine/homoserine lactone efflux protein
MVLLLAGFLLSLLGSLPPGMISAGVAYMALQGAYRRSLWMAAGASFAEFFQAVGAVMLAEWFTANPGVTRWFEVGIVPVFFSLAIYFFRLPPPVGLSTNREGISPSGGVKQSFAQGILLSLFNLLAIPYWFVYCSWLHVAGWWPERSNSNTLVFATGVSLGTGTVLFLYAWLSDRLLRRSPWLLRHANTLVGGLFLALGFHSLWRIG